MVRTKYSWSTTKKALALGVQKPNQECSITGWYRHFCVYKTNRTDPWTIPHSKWRGFVAADSQHWRCWRARDLHQRQFQITKGINTIINIAAPQLNPIDPQKISKNYIYPNSLGCSFVSSRGTVRVKLSHVKYQHESEFYNIQHVFMGYS